MGLRKCIHEAMSLRNLEAAEAARSRQALVEARLGAEVQDRWEEYHSHAHKRIQSCARRIAVRPAHEEPLSRSRLARK